MLEWKPRDRTNGHKTDEAGCCPACGVSLVYYADRQPAKPAQDGTLRLACPNPSCNADLVETEHFDLWTAKAWAAAKQRARKPSGADDALGTRAGSSAAARAGNAAESAAASA